MDEIAELQVIVQRSLEHHVLEQMCETGPSRRIILRADIKNDINADERRLVVFVQDDCEAVIEPELSRLSGSEPAVFAARPRRGEPVARKSPSIASTPGTRCRRRCFALPVRPIDPAATRLTGATSQAVFMAMSTWSETLDGTCRAPYASRSMHDTPATGQPAIEPTGLPSSGPTPRTPANLKQTRTTRRCSRQISAPRGRCFM